MVVVEDLVRNTRAVDAANDLDVGAAIGFREVAGESAVERDGEQDLKEGGWDVVALEFDFVLVASLNGSGEDGVDGEEEEVVVTGGGIRGCCIGRGRIGCMLSEMGCGAHGLGIDGEVVLEPSLAKIVEPSLPSLATEEDVFVGGIDVPDIGLLDDSFGLPSEGYEVATDEGVGTRR